MQQSTRARRGKQKSGLHAELAQNETGGDGDGLPGVGTGNGWAGFGLGLGDEARLEDGDTQEDPARWPTGPGPAGDASSAAGPAVETAVTPITVARKAPTATGPSSGPAAAGAGPGPTAEARPSAAASAPRQDQGRSQQQGDRSGDDDDDEDSVGDDERGAAGGDREMDDGGINKEASDRSWNRVGRKDNADKGKAKGTGKGKDKVKDKNSKPRNNATPAAVPPPRPPPPGTPTGCARVSDVPATLSIIMVSNGIGSTSLQRSQKNFTIIISNNDGTGEGTLVAWRRGTQSLHAAQCSAMALYEERAAVFRDKWPNGTVSVATTSSWVRNTLDMDGVTGRVLYNLHPNHFGRIKPALNVSDVDVEVRKPLLELAYRLIKTDEKTFGESGECGVGDFARRCTAARVEGRVPDFDLLVALQASGQSGRARQERTQNTVRGLTEAAGPDVVVRNVPAVGDCFFEALALVEGGGATAATTRARMSMVLFAATGLSVRRDIQRAAQNNGFDSGEEYLTTLSKSGVYMDLELAILGMNGVPAWRNVPVFQYRVAGPQRSAVWRRLLDGAEDAETRADPALAAMPDGTRAICFLPDLRHVVGLEIRRRQQAPAVVIQPPEPSIAVQATLNMIPNTLKRILSDGALANLAAVVLLRPPITRLDVDGRDVSEETIVNEMVATVFGVAQSSMALQVPALAADKLAGLDAMFAERYLEVAEPLLKTGRFVDILPDNVLLAQLDAAAVIPVALAARRSSKVFADEGIWRRRIRLLRADGARPFEILIQVAKDTATHRQTHAGSHDDKDEEEVEAEVMKDTLQFIRSGFTGHAVALLERRKPELRQQVLDMSKLNAELEDYYSGEDDLDKLIDIFDNMTADDDALAKAYADVPEITVEIILNKLKKMGRSAAGVTGASAYIMQALAKSPGNGTRYLAALVRRANALLRGIPSSVDGIRRIIALAKKAGMADGNGVLLEGGKPRFIQINSTLMRIVFSVVADELHDLVRQYAPHELAVGTSFGTQKAHERASRLLGSGYVLFSVDFKGAFPTLSRLPIARIIKDERPDLAFVFRQSYAHSTHAFNAARSRSISLRGGMPEGAPEVPAVWAIVVGWLLQKHRPPAGIEVFAILDDISFAWRPDMHDQAVTWVREFITLAKDEANMTISESKSKLLLVPSRLAVDVDDLYTDAELAELQQQQQQQGGGRPVCRIKNLPTFAPYATVNLDFESFVFMGGDLSCLETFRSKPLFDKCYQLVQRAEIIVESLGRSHAPQALHLLRSTVVGKVVYHAQITRMTPDVVQHLADVDEKIDGLLDQLMSAPARLPPDIESLRDLRRQPIASGGLGISRLTHIGPTARIAAVAAVNQYMVDSNLENASWPASDVSVLKETQSTFTSYFPQSVTGRTSAFYQLGLQASRLLITAIQKEAQERIEIGKSPSTALHIGQIKSKYSTAGISASFTSSSNVVYGAYLRYRYRMIDSSEFMAEDAAAECKLHEPTVNTHLTDGSFSHFLSCASASKKIAVGRHNEVVEAVDALLRGAGLRPKKEHIVESEQQAAARRARPGVGEREHNKSAIYKSTRADIVVDLAGQRQAIDVTIASTRTGTFDGSDSLEVAQKQAEQVKSARYRGPLSNTNTRLVTVAFTPMGFPVGPTAVWLKDIGKRIDENNDAMQKFRRQVAQAFQKAIGTTVLDCTGYRRKPK